MVEPDIAKLHIDKRDVASRQRKKRRYFSGMLLLALFFVGLLLYHRGVLTPSMGVQVVAVQNLFPSQTFTLLNASGYVVAQRKLAVVNGSPPCTSS